MEVKERELEYFKRAYKSEVDKRFKAQTELNKIGVKVNVFGGLIINDEYVPDPTLYEIKLKGEIS